MKAVGITGGMGSGKTTVCRIFELLGVPVFYADDEAKKLYEDAKIRSKVVRLFGKKVLGQGNKIDKKKLAETAFADRSLLAKLNAIIHPEVGKKFAVWKKKQKGVEYVVKEAAVMIESGAYKELDYLVSINSPKELRINRIIERNNLPLEEINRRINEQMSDKEREKYADAIISNDNAHSLIEQVTMLHKKLSAK